MQILQIGTGVFFKKYIVLHCRAAKNMVLPGICVKFFFMNGAYRTRVKIFFILTCTTGVHIPGRGCGPGTGSGRADSAPCPRPPTRWA
jgi:hypothetical protein